MEAKSGDWKPTTEFFLNMGSNTRFAFGVPVRRISLKNGSINGNSGESRLGRQNSKEHTVYETEGQNRSLVTSDSWFHAQIGWWC